jgi:hypothetical protein
MLNELTILRAEYERAINAPLFDSPADYCILLNLIRDRIEQLENK